MIYNSKGTKPDASWRDFVSIHRIRIQEDGGTEPKLLGSRSGAAWLRDNDDDDSVSKWYHRSVPHTHTVGSTDDTAFNNHVNVFCSLEQYRCRSKKTKTQLN